jgi:hypothetical protein
VKTDGYPQDPDPDFPKPEYHPFGGAISKAERIFAAMLLIVAMLSALAGVAAALIQ